MTNIKADNDKSAYDFNFTDLDGSALKLSEYKNKIIVIVNVASQAGTFSVPYGASYAASKHGIVGFTKAIRNEFRTKGDISVGVILPGYITRTGMYDDMIKSSDTIENLDEYIYYNQLLVGTSEPEDSANAVIHAITTDSPHIHVNGLNGNIMFNINRFYVTLAELFPRF